MRRTLSTIALAVLTVGLLGSCSKINERIDDLEKKVDGLENEKIASIQTQVANIGNSISDLGAIRSNIQSLTDEAKAQGQDIAALQAADKALGSRIEELSKYVGDTLKAYATEEWVKATFSTLEQYEKTCDTIAKIDARIGALDENLSKKIADCADSLTTWVNGQFEGYYTVAEMDAKLALMKSAVDSAKAAGEITDAKADSLAVELAKVQPAIDSAKAQLTREYTAAIDTAIKTLEGNLTKQIQDEIEKVNETVTALAERVTNLERDVFLLTGRVIALENMIQSVSIVPDYSDCGVRAVDSTLEITCYISPVKALEGLRMSNFTILCKEVRSVTKAGDVDVVKVERATFDYDKGIAVVRADIRNNLKRLSGEEELSVAVNVKVRPWAGVSDYTTDFVPVHNDTLTYAYLIKTSEFRKKVNDFEPPVSFFMTKGGYPEYVKENDVLTAVIFHTKWADALPGTEDATHKKVAKSASDKPGSLEEDLWAVLENNTEVHVYTKKDIIITDNDGLAYMFAGMFGLKVVDMTGVQIPENTDMSHMFENARGMESLILGKGFTIPTEGEKKVDMFKKFAFDSETGAEVKYEAGAGRSLTNNVVNQIKNDNPGSKVETTTDPVTGDVIIKASSLQNYAVIFDLNGVSGTAPETQYIAKNGIAKKPADPKVTGFVFTGWYKEKACTSAWDFATDTIVADTTLFACWDRTIESILSTVKSGFPRSNVVSEVPDTAWTNASASDCRCYVAPGEAGGNALWVKKNHTDSLCLPLAKLASREGDTWKCTDEGATWTFNMVNDELASIAFAAEDSQYAALNGTYSAPVSVTFVNPEGDVISTMPATQYILNGNKATKPSNPNDNTPGNSGFHTFEGWYKTKDATTGELSDKWDFNNVVTEDITLYAQWQTTIEKIISKAETEFPFASNEDDEIHKCTYVKDDKTWTAPDDDKGTNKMCFGLWLYDSNTDGYTAKGICVRVTKKTDGIPRTSSTYYSRNVLKTKDIYKYEGGLGTYTFTIENGVFNKMEFEATDPTYAPCNGTYTPQQQPN